MITSMPNIHIYTPGDINEMEICLNEFYSLKSPAYLRVGKMDNPPILSELTNIQPNNYFTNKTQSSICIRNPRQLQLVANMAVPEPKPFVKPVRINARLVRCKLYQ